MATINSPAKILKLWNKVQDRYGVSDEDRDTKKKGSTKEQAAAKQSEKITKGLTVLKSVAKGGVKTPAQVKRFETTHGKVVLVLRKYCKTIKGAKLEGAQDMNKLRKSVKQLTVVVEELNYQQLSDDESGDADLNEIMGVDTATLDQALEDPNFAAGPDEDIKFDEADEASASVAPPKAPPAPPSSQTSAAPKAPPAPPSGQARFASRLKALAPTLEKADAANKAVATQARAQIAEGNKAFQGKQYDAANAALDRAESLIKQALTAAVPKAPPPPPDGNAAIKRLNALAPNIKAALAGPNKARVQSLFATVNGLIKNADHVQASKTLDELELLVKAGPGVPPAPPPPPETAKVAGLAAALAQWTTARARVIESLKSLEKAIRALKDPNSDAAIILVKAIQSNLTARPESAQAVAELERYLSTDQIVADAEDPNGFGIKIEIRGTLLPALAGIRAALGA